LTIYSPFHVRYSAFFDKENVMEQVTVVELTTYGGPDVLRAVRRALPAPGAGEATVRHTAVGVNFADIYHRTGLYPLPALPAVPGVEAAGVVTAVGPGVTAVAPGDRVAYAGLPAGSYSSARTLPAARLIRLPDTVTDETAAAGLLRAITAHMLYTHVCRVRPGDSVFVHAAAGGLGQVLGQWGARLGARMFGSVGSAEKEAVARSRGYAELVRYREADFAAAVMDWTGGRGVDFAIDGIGGDTLARSVAIVRPFGVLASVGQAGDPALPPLSAIGAAGVYRPSVLRFMNDPACYAEGAQAALAAFAAGLRVDVGTRLPLTQAGEAHRLLGAGAGGGAILLIP
jgi:NADPH2:quinone reductase